MATISLTRGLCALVDEVDLPELTKFRWHARLTPTTWYASRRLRRPDGSWTTLYMHTLLTGWPRVDHINGKGYDNRRLNLRPATHAQNMANKAKIHGSSRYKGVAWDSSGRCWRAQIMRNQQRFHLGSYMREEDAALAYDAAARQLFGQFAALNFPGPGERSALLVGVA